MLTSFWNFIDDYTIALTFCDFHFFITWSFIWTLVWHVCSIIPIRLWACTINLSRWITNRPSILCITEVYSQIRWRLVTFGYLIYWLVLVEWDQIGHKPYQPHGKLYRRQIKAYRPQPYRPHFFIVYEIITLSYYMPIRHRFIHVWLV